MLVLTEIVAVTHTTINTEKARQTLKKLSAGHMWPAGLQLNHAVLRGMVC